MQLTQMKIPGALVTTIVAAMLYGAMKELNVQFAGADWLPIALAILGYALKYVQVWGQQQQPVEGGPIAPQAAPTLEPKSKVVRFILG